MIKRLCVYWFKRKGWRFVGSVPKRERRAVLVFGPQSHYSDLIIAIAIKTITNFNVEIAASSESWNWKSRLLLKASGAFRWMGDPESEQWRELIKKLKSDERYSVAFTINSPNGNHETKSYDFYPIALASDSPIVLVALDHRRRVAKFHNPFFLSGYRSRDLSYIENFYEPFYWYLRKHS